MTETSLLLRPSAPTLTTFHGLETWSTPRERNVARVAARLTGTTAERPFFWFRCPRDLAGLVLEATALEPEPWT